MPRCPTCRKALHGSREEIGARCPECRDALYERSLDGAQEPGPEDPLCAVHSGSLALGTCQRCGNFICVVCRTRWRDRTWCMACVDRELESPDASPEEARSHLRQSTLGLVFGLAGWIVCGLAFAIMLAGFMTGAQEQANLAVVGLGFFVLMASPLVAVLGVGQAAAAIRARGDHMILATAGLILSGLNIAVVTGLLALAVWQN